MPTIGEMRDRLTKAIRKCEKAGEEPNILRLSQKARMGMKRIDQLVSSEGGFVHIKTRDGHKLALHQQIVRLEEK